MNRTLDYYLTGKIEGVMEILQQLSEDDGFTIYPTKKYIVEKLTELKLTKYVESIVEKYYTEQE